MASGEKITMHSQVEEKDPVEPVEDVKESIRLLEDLKFFLATAPANWQENQVIRRYYLNHDEGFVSCVYWNNFYFITGTDIVRCIVYKIEHFGRKIIDRKKFEEGIFSDLRNLKTGPDAILEPPRSEFLEFLFKNSCLRTQKKQKVFFWFNVPHDKLMADALERDLKKEQFGQSATTVAVKEPALSFKYDDTKTIFTQLTDHFESQTRSSDADVYTRDNNNFRNNEQGERNFAGHSEKEVSKIKMEPDQEDDFPLDYLDAAEEFEVSSNEYIELEPSTHNSVYTSSFDDSYGSFMDPSIFIRPGTSTRVASQLVNNDKYLIEQTQQIKTPLYPQTNMSSRSHSKAPSITPSNLQGDDGTSQFASSRRSVGVQPTHSYSNNQHYQAPQPYHYYFEQSPVGQLHYENQGGSSIGYPYEQDYLIGNYAPFHHNGTPSEHYFQLPPYLIMKDQDYVIPNPVYARSPKRRGAFQSPHRQSKSSKRQQQISSNMMKKRMMMQHMRHQRSTQSIRPGSERPISFSSHRDGSDVLGSRSSDLITAYKDETRSDTTETLVPTPESSINHSSDHDLMKIVPSDLNKQ